MIKELIVEGLNGQKKELKFSFNEDLNLLTGKNGCGKTTLLKLIWYINSCNFRCLLNEISFQTISLKTDEYSVDLSFTEKDGYLSLSVNDEPHYHIQINKINEYPYRIIIQSKQIQTIQQHSINSIFFPTFRRIEGGFSMESMSDSHYGGRAQEELKEALSDLSSSLSNIKHKFVSSISTEDIVQLLQSEYTKKSEQANHLQENLYSTILNRIKNRRGIAADQLIEQIESEVESGEQRRQELYQPFNVLSDLINKFFEHKGISLKRLTFGDVDYAISSDKLSAGEKQMLSFLCYNTFSNNSIIFIDEPELSLHPDWQRTLIPTLLSQNKGNQFFMATHSPFIYTRYSDKEIIINEDRGGIW